MDVIIVEMASVDELQRRIDTALRADPHEARTFSEYRDSTDDVLDRLWAAAQDGGVEAALDEFDRLRSRENPGRLRHALMQFIAQHPDAAKAGLRVPSLEARAPWTVLPSKREE
jgi:hypothetical protein